MNGATLSRHSRLTRVVSAWMIFFMAVPTSLPTWAGMTDALTPSQLADEPLQITPAARPNVLYTMDDSTSMASDYTPEYIVGGNSTGVCRNYTNSSNNTVLPTTIANLLRVDSHYKEATGVICGEVVNGSALGHAYTSMRGTSIVAGKQVISAVAKEKVANPPVMNSAFNRLFYDPLVTYEAPYKPQSPKERYPDIDGVADLDWTNVPSDQYWSTAPQFFDLKNNGKAYAYLYCNSDWNPSVVYDSVQKKFTSFDPNECRYNAEPYAQSGSSGPLTAPAVVSNDQYPADYGWGDARSFKYKPQQMLYCDTKKFIPAVSGTKKQSCTPRKSDGTAITPQYLSDWSAIPGNENKGTYNEAADLCVCSRTSPATTSTTKFSYGMCDRTVSYTGGCSQTLYDCTKPSTWRCIKPGTLTYPDCTKTKQVPRWQCKRTELRVYATPAGGLTVADYIWNPISNQFEMDPIKLPGGMSGDEYRIRTGRAAGGEAGEGTVTCMEGETKFDSVPGETCPGGSSGAHAACIAQGFTCSTSSQGGDTRTVNSKAEADALGSAYACSEQPFAPKSGVIAGQVQFWKGQGYTCSARDTPDPCPAGNTYEQCVAAGYTCGSGSGGTYSRYERCDRNTNGLGGACPDGGLVDPAPAANPEMGTGVSGGGWSCKPNTPASSTNNPAKWELANCYNNVIATCDARYIADANGAGEICRHNRGTYTPVTNKSAINTTAGGMLASFATAYSSTTNEYTSSYPYTTPVNCQPTGMEDAGYIPLHYYRTRLTWCAAPDTTGRHTGWGNGVKCTAKEKSAANPYPYFSNYLGNDSDDVFTKVTLDIENKKVNGKDEITHQYLDENDVIRNKITRTFKEEMTNYGNWFAYYRTRALAARTVTSLAFFDAIDKETTLRVGFQALNYGKPFAGSDQDFLAISEFPANRNDFLKKVFAPTLVAKKVTPTIDAMNRAGMYFKSGGGFNAGAADPIVASCQKNFHILFTDGATDQETPKDLPTGVGDFDKTVPSGYPWLAGTASDPLKVFGSALIAGQPWPYPIRDDNGTKGSLADLALYYWATDLRTGSDSLAKNNVVASSTDPATWQRVNFSALAMGVEGTLVPTGAESVRDSLIAGGLEGGTKWPYISWPSSPDKGKEAQAIDDLWHATMNGFGQFANTQSPEELKYGLASILAEIQGAKGSRAADMYEAFDVTSATASKSSYTYRVSFEMGWSGDVKKTQVNAAGYMGKDEWSARKELTALLTPTVGEPAPWNVKRFIFTRDGARAGGTAAEGGAAIPFRYKELGAAQKSSLTLSSLSLEGRSVPSMQEAVVDFLRGSNTLETNRPNGFRKREAALGDIVNARAVYVGAASGIVYDPSLNAGYAGHVTNISTRKSAVYAAANDGMLHAFDASDGGEIWAYIPGALFRTEAEKGLVNLAVPSIGDPSFKHYYYVDATPRVMDAKLGSRWATLLVGGLGKGGKAYYALDVTKPELPDLATPVKDADDAATVEGTLTSKSLWEFSNKQAKGKLGYTFGRANIVKLTVGSKEEWKVIVPSGYANDDGKGYIFILNAETGKLEATMAAGSDSGEIGHLAGYVKTTKNQLVTEIYAGDLKGNVWRFDLGNLNDVADLASSSRVQKLAELKKPITTEPRIEVDVFDGTENKYRWVFVGTGRLLGKPDLTDNSQQSFYAILDGTHDAPTKITSTTPPVEEKDLVVVSNYAEGVKVGAGKRGWYFDFKPGYRMVYNATIVNGTVNFIATIPGKDLECDTGQPGMIYSRKFGTGKTALAGGAESVEAATGAVGVNVLQTSTGAKAIYSAADTTKNEPNTEEDKDRDKGRGLDDDALKGKAKSSRITWRTITK